MILCSALETEKEMEGNEMTKVKDQMQVSFRDYLGVTLMCMADCIAAGLMTSWFMQYLTDYADLGTWGAVLGSTLLICMRLFDAVNDPLEGWIMDRAKEGRYGKYRPFIFLSIILESAGLAALFFIPSGVAAVPALSAVWVVAAYLIYDVGSSFYAPNLIYRSLTLDSNKRGKLMIAPRMMSMIMGMVTGSLIAIVNGINGNIGNMHIAFGITVATGAGITAVISLIGIAMVQEKYHPKESFEDSRVRIADIFRLFQENEALRVKFGATIFSGFIWTFLFATQTYYIKWAYCADLTDGTLDAAKYGTLSLISSMMMLVPLLLGTAIAVPLMKVLKTPVRTYRFVIVMEAIPCGILFILQMLGLLQSSPVIFLTMVGITATAIGIGYIPNEALNIEAMDYEVYKNGKDRSALCNATAKFLDKAQGAVSAGMIGIVLVAVGYVVDSATGNYVGQLSNIPGMLNWFIVIMGLIPFILGAISLWIYRKYPITPEIAADMREKLSVSNSTPVQK